MANAMYEFSVDPQTDAQIQALIRSEFSHCTVIMIAHRVQTLLDFDKVAIFDMGRITEFGDPLVLLADQVKIKGSEVLE